MSPYIPVIVISAIILGFLTSARIAYFLANKKWGFKGEPLFFTTVACASASAIAMGFISGAMIEMGGILFGIVGLALEIPLIGLVWIFIVGGNKAIEKILNGLLAKV